MNFLSRENPDRWHQLAWWLCVITLPWLEIANSISLILLVVVSGSGGGLKERLLRIKSAKWAWPFFIYYVLLLIGMAYTPDVDNGLFTLDKKITFLGLPLVAIVGRELNEEFIRFLKLSFVYSCTAVIFLCLIIASMNFLNQGEAYNFDISTAVNFKELHPDASSAWMHFSYVQLSQWGRIHPAYFSMYLVFCLVILFVERDLFQDRKWLHSIIGILMICFIALLSTRMAVIAFVFVALYFGVIKIRQSQFKPAFQILCVVLFLGFLLWLNPVARFRVIEEPMKTEYTAQTTVTQWNSVSYRLLEWQGSWSIIKNHFLFGVGTCGWKVAMNNFYSNYNSSTIGLNYNSHNQFLQTWMENGILALMVFAFCVFGYLFRASLDQSYVAFILIFSLMCLTESIVERQKGVVFFTLFQTLYLAFENKSK